ncbi:MAG: HAD family phosphatase [Candidatus Omnitrophota bacterium]|nr:HAD family phosphatase [Candidatus Omnitrophota bacterium]
MITQKIAANIKAILFDLGNVTVNFDHYLAVERIKNFTDKNTGEIYQLFFDSNLTGLFEEGKLTPVEFYRKVKELLSMEIGYEEFVAIWNEIFFLTDDNLKVHNLIKKLKEKFTVVLISNINKLHYDYLIKEYAIFEEFDKHVLSYEVGSRKPGPLIYRKALKEAGAGIKEAIYIDDREDLVKEGKALGIKSICFKNYLALLASLSNLGVGIS